MGRVRKQLQVLALCFFAAGTISGHAAEYRLGPGDVIDVSIFGSPEMQRRVMVNADGEVSYPFLGMVKVSGMGAGDVRLLIRNQLVEKGIIKNSDVSIEIAQYRPVYVGGDVARPGSFPFQPGMTVRQAVVLAGGYDVVRLRAGRDVFVDATEYRGEYESLWLDFIKQDARVKRLRMELETGSDQTALPRSNSPVPAHVEEKVTALESEQMRLRRADLEKEREYLKRSLQLAQEQIDALTGIQKEDDDNLQQRSDDVARVKGLTDRGLSPVTRLIEEQRQLLAARQRAFTTANQMAVTKNGVMQIERRIDQVKDQRRIDVVRELQDASVDLEKLRARLQATGDKLLYATTTRSQIALGKFGEPEIAVFRKQENKEVRISSGEDFELAAGDVVDVALRVARALE